MDVIFVEFSAPPRIPHTKIMMFVSRAGGHVCLVSSQVRSWTFGLLVALFARPCLADELTVFAAPIRDYMNRIGPTLDQSSGLMMEITAGAFRQARLSATVAPSVPWARAQALAKDKPGSILVLLARTPVREEQWQWLSMVYTDKIYGYTLKGRPAFTSYEDIRARRPRVGVMLGSASESMLKGMGVSTEAVVDIERNFMKLLSGRLDVVLQQGMEVPPAIMAVESLHRAEFSSRIADLRRTPISTLPLWVVTSKKTSAADVVRLRAALDSFKQCVEYKAIVRKYEDRNLIIEQ
ncbi:substrate-binding periplasmic protein [Niveibacterium terrae]|uniref:substrate-binding periplasmic protein n=1 Tax=Niveibacterium terrae TaxID=3373598 RepID=UPI003A920ACD